MRPRANTTTTTSQPLPTTLSRSQAEQSLLSLLERQTPGGSSISIGRRARSVEPESEPPSDIHMASPSPPATIRALRPATSLDLEVDLSTLVERSIALQTSPPRKSQPLRRKHPYRPTFSTSPSSASAPPTYDSSSSSSDTKLPSTVRRPIIRRVTAPEVSTVSKVSSPPASSPLLRPTPVPTPRSVGGSYSPLLAPSPARTPRPRSPRPRSPRPPPTASVEALAAATLLSAQSNQFALRPNGSHNLNGTPTNTIASRRRVNLSSPSSPQLSAIAASNFTSQPLNKPSSLPSSRARSVTHSPRPMSLSPPPMSPPILTPAEEEMPLFDIDRAARRLRDQTGRVNFSEVVPPPEEEEQEEPEEESRKRPKLGRRWSLW